MTKNERQRSYLLKPTILAIIIAVVLSMHPAGSARAMDLRGSIFSEFYGYKEPGLNHYRPYAGLNADFGLWRGKRSRTLDLYTNFRWTTDLKTKLATDPQIFFYNTYLHLANVPSRSHFYLGRQFVYNGAGSLLMDGIRAKYVIVPQAQIELFGGSAVSSAEPKKIRKIADFGSFGGRLSINPDRSTRIGLNLLSRRLDGYSEIKRAAVDIEQVVAQWRFFGRAAYNLNRSSMAELLGRISFQPYRWYFEGEFLWREPSVSDNTIFGIINYNRYREFRLNGRRTIIKNLNFDARLMGTIFDNDNAWNLQIGFIGAWYNIGWRHQTGYAGINDGLFLLLNLRLNARWETYASANLGRYKVQKEQPDRNDSYSSQAGILWRPANGLTARVEGQYLKNAVMTEETRIYVKLAKDFSFGRGGR
ncbi:exported hypothetical protein [Candidatus Zixiibacteriota bacterium]|nr:exported hypothetical protein [candidate division Zixibacteria bacterium]